ncbi:alanine dehydrogenase [Putridiphycobacter roseus]|uniref:alanine dehydrogenase n=1 Tax=Putridiphycobacter roseus TaxID=2219161 RepID=A0A2W1N1Q0_9FLAO|nr:alanine dehydrogenase [Putridiphycobacter roseus]PZE16871.1 alanine dehydrogenase [Putridiphycobacter roseus]
MITDPETLKSLMKEGSLLPQEEMLAVKQRRGKLSIGIPKETSFQENRVAFIPETVQLLVSNGHHVIVESNAGQKSQYSDRDYAEAGAEIALDRKAVFESNMIFKVAPPTQEEIDLMPGDQTLISALQLTLQPKETLISLMKKQITAIAWDYIRDDLGIFPIVRAMGEIAGTTAVLIAAELLSNYNNGKGIMMGGVAGVRPTEVVILGAGTVGENACRAALGLGASIKVFDNSISKLRRLQNDIGQKVYTSVIQPKLLEKAIRRADAVIGAIRAPFGRTPCVITEAMIMQMKPHSVLVDISIDQGGCFETSRVTNHNNPTFIKHDIIHYCVPNIASRVSRTASIALSNIFTPIVLEIGESGGCKNMIRKDAGFRSGVYVYKGKLTSQILGKVFDLPYKDIELLLAAF